MHLAAARQIAVGGVQLDAATGHWERNLVRVERELRAGRRGGMRLVVLPELFSNGYAFDAEYAEPPLGPTVRRLVALAAELDLVIATALYVRTASGVFTDRAYVIGPSGVLGEADKGYLWGPEVGALTASEQPGVVVQTPVGTVGVAICYEAGFPEMVRDLALRGAEIIAVPAAFGLPRLHAWELMTRSRALENGCFLVAAGLTGRDSRGNEFAGHSRIVSPRGEVMSGLDREEGMVNSEVDLADIDRARSEIPYLHSLAVRGSAKSAAAARLDPAVPTSEKPEIVLN
ncbi:carbon-nitrogen hydrolase family protein [Mycobacterium sp. 4D054]|uniref:carbon-nitrogen hydrolase family protein n=1 Tax=unclassified Mycobacterium TaxID=2642494 RepID=UPI0021B3438F|nr:carbon-nitrogen hydrolase family protein [Mycobacterium sp. SMC-8]UXA12222.1 carbon-nitrogen hydrolase family protein [Mycobacterium sp. SMC-8]